jgi:predicted esterase
MRPSIYSTGLARTLGFPLDYHQTDMPRNTEHLTFSAKLDCRYLLSVPEQVDRSTVLVLALHGYGSNPEDMLRLTAAMVGGRHIVASLQAPNQHYLDRGSPGVEPAIGYNWGVRDHWGSVVRLHHDMVLEVLAALRGRFGIPAARCMLTGFSQPVGLNYRFAATWPGEVRGVAGICGGVPRDWEEDKYQTVTAALLHISRQEDEFYRPEVSLTFPERLRKHASDVAFHLLPGGHRFPSAARHIVQPWMERVFAV